MRYRIRPVFMLGWFLLCPLALGAATAETLKPAVLVLPLQAGPGVSGEHLYLGWSLQAVLENVLLLHSGLEECRADSYYDKLFPSGKDLQDWSQGRTPVPAALKNVDPRYLFTGRFDLRHRRAAAEVELVDRLRGTKFIRSLPVDSPRLKRFRQGFLELLQQAGIPSPKIQRSKTLWEESLSLPALSLLGRGLYAYYSAKLYRSENPVYDLSFYQEALKLAPRSYLLLTSFGRALYGQNVYAEAQKWFERALAYNRWGVDAADGLMQVADQIGKEDSEEMWLVRKAEIKNQEPKIALASLWNRWGEGYYSLNLYEEALARFEPALALAREAKDRAREGAILHNLGRTYARLNRYEEALAHYQQALSLWRELEDRAGEGATLDYLGVAHADRSEYKKAITYYEQALAVRRGADRAGEGYTLSNLGSAYLSLGLYAKALDYLQQALSVRRELKDCANEATTLYNLGVAYAKLGDYENALAFYEQALTVAREAANRRLEGSALNSLGVISYSRREYDKAIAYYQQALRMAHEVRYRQGEGIALHNLGRVYIDLGRYEEAIVRFGEALMIRREAPDPEGEGYTLNGLGIAYSRLGQHQKAVNYYEDALTIRRMVDQVGEAATLINLMLEWKAVQRPRLAVFYGKQGINIYQDIRGKNQSLDSALRQSFVKSKEDSYRELADLLITQGRLPEAQQVLDMLKNEEYFEFVRGNEKEASSRRADLTPDEARLEKRYREIADHLTALGKEYGDLLTQKSRTAAQEQRLRALAEELKVAREYFRRFLDRLPNELGGSPEVAQKVVREIKELTGLSEDLRELGSGAVALYTLVGEEKYRVILFTPDTQKAAEYHIGATDLSRKVLDFRQALQNPWRDPVPLAQELYRILVGPVAKDLEGAKAQTLMWSLDGVLRYLPMAALHDGQKYLIERYRNVVFTPASHARLKDRPRANWKGLGLGVSKAHAGFDPLPGVEEELRGIIREETGDSQQGVFPGTIKLDEAFTAEVMQAALRERYPLVHIASHFQFQPGNATDSFLLLGNGGRLTLAEIHDWPASMFGGVELLTLSACSTATGDAGTDGKEIDGLGEVAQRQGAKAVVASLWPVADESTKVLMQVFYKRRKSRPEMPKAEALRQAQLALLSGAEGGPELAQKKRGAILIAADERGAASRRFRWNARAPYAHPFYWAPFILIGNWQ